MRLINENYFLYILYSTEFKMAAGGQWTFNGNVMSRYAGKKKKRGVKKGTKRGPYKKTIASVANQVSNLTQIIKASGNELSQIRRFPVVNSAGLLDTGLVHALHLAKAEDDNATAGTPERIGDKITLVKAKYKGYIRWNTANSTHQTVRIMVVKWKKQAQSTYAAISGMFEGAGGDSLYSFEKKFERKDYQILWSKYYVRDLNKPEVVLNFDIDLKKIQPTFTTEANTTITHNGVYMFLDSSVNTNGPVVAINEIMYYYP